VRMSSDPNVRGQAFNFSNEMPVSVIDLTGRILRLMGSTLQPEIRSEASHEIRTEGLDASFFFQAEDGIRDRNVTGVQTCALPISIEPEPAHPLVCGNALDRGGTERPLEGRRRGRVAIRAQRHQAIYYQIGRTW